jgi:hypothetical protein
VNAGRQRNVFGLEVNTMSADRRAADAADLTAGGARRTQPTPAEYSAELMESCLIFAVPVAMPVMVTWLSIGNMPGAGRCVR